MKVIHIQKNPMWSEDFALCNSTILLPNTLSAWKIKQWDLSKNRVCRKCFKAVLLLNDGVAEINGCQILLQTHPKLSGGYEVEKGDIKKVFHDPTDVIIFCFQN